MSSSRVDPETGRLVIIEMNPRVSRSSALASKATGFPIAHVAAKLAVGYTLDELDNRITGGATPASFEPSIDYVVTKVPRFNFDKFPEARPRLSTQMRSVGEVMAMGRSFQESLQKALRSLETGLCGLDEIVSDENGDAIALLRGELRAPGPERIRYVADAFRRGLALREVCDLSGIDPWFVAQIEELVDIETTLRQTRLDDLDAPDLLRLKAQRVLGPAPPPPCSVRRSPMFVRAATRSRCDRYTSGSTRVQPSSGSATAYLYSTYEEECESAPTQRAKIMVLGGGPNRIGQGIEFDYCCVQAALAIRDAGFESIMVNCNPETVSTDYDVSDRLYFEPLTLEDLLEIVDKEQPQGIIVQYGGQTPLTLARSLEAAGAPVVRDLAGLNRSG